MSVSETYELFIVKLRNKVLFVHPHHICSGLSYFLPPVHVRQIQSSLIEQSPLC